MFDNLLLCLGVLVQLCIVVKMVNSVGDYRYCLDSSCDS